MTNRPTPQQFLSDLCRDLVKHDGDRPTFIAGYAKHMEAREAEIRKEAATAARISEIRYLGGVIDSDPGCNVDTVFDIRLDELRSVKANPQQ
jgi:hypothetical protein